MSLKLILFWLIVGNYSYQWLGPHEWAVALDHSYFQAVAIASVWLVAKLFGCPLPRPERK